MRRVTIEDRAKVYSINELERYVSNYNDKNKNIATLKIEVVGFNADYLDIKLRVCEGFTVNKKLWLSDCITGLENGTIYIVNPSFVRKYKDQKWYRNYYDCLRIDGEMKYFVDGNGNRYLI